VNYGCEPPEPDTEMIQLNEELAGFYSAISYSINGEEQLFGAVDSVSLSIEPEENDIVGQIQVQYYRSSSPFRYGEGMNYWLIDQNMLRGAVHDTVEFDLIGNTLFYDFAARNGDSISLVLTK
jgi:hypothetical protein